MAKNKTTSAAIQLAKSNKTNYAEVPVSGIKDDTNDELHWWLLPTEKIAGAIKSLIIRMDQNNHEQTQQFATFARMYGNNEMCGLGGLGTNDGMSVDYSSNIPKFNVIQSAIDTLQAKFCKDNPKPIFLSTGGDYDAKLRCEKSTQFTQGIFQENHVYDIANNQVMLDALRYGTGGLRFYIGKDNKIKVKWIFIDDIKVDQTDGMKQKPRSLMFCTIELKENLLTEYPDKADIINEITGSRNYEFRTRDTVVDVCVTCEAFHLANGKVKGRHVVGLDDKVLLDEEYDDEKEFDTVFFRYYLKPMGFYGRGVAETLFQNQIEINKILLMIQQCQELQASPLVLIPNGTDIATDVIGVNNIARIVRYNAGAGDPKFVAPQGVSQEVYDHLRWWIQASYQEVGVSITSATGEKQSGVNSAVAMRTMVDIESGRFVMPSKNWEKFFVDCAHVCMKLGKRIYEKTGSYTVSYMDKKSKIVKEIPWNKINSEDDKYIIQCDTISSFPQSAAGRIQTVMDMISAQWITKERGMELANLDPDTDGEVARQTSSLRLCEKNISLMVEDEIYNHPEPYIDLTLALKVSIMTYNQLKVDECPEERLQLVRNWIQELVEMANPQLMDPLTAKLQAVFADMQPPAAPIAPQTSMSPAGRQPTALPMQAPPANV